MKKFAIIFSIVFILFLLPSLSQAEDSTITILNPTENEKLISGQEYKINFELSEAEGFDFGQAWVYFYYYDYSFDHFNDILLEGKFDINSSAKTGKFTFIVPSTLPSGSSYIYMGVFNSNQNRNIQAESQKFYLESSLKFQIEEPNKSSIWELNKEYTIKFKFIPDIKRTINSYIYLYKCQSGRTLIEELGYTNTNEFKWKVSLDEGIDSKADGYSIIVNNSLTNDGDEYSSDCFQIVEKISMDSETINKNAIIIKNKSNYNKLKGKILIKVEDSGKAYYMNSNKEEALYLGKPVDAFNVMREKGVGITNSNLEKIPIGLMAFSGADSDNDGLSNMLEEAMKTDMYNTDTDYDGHKDKLELENGYKPNGSGKIVIDKKLSDSQKGKILLQVENKGEAWYVNPSDGKRYFLGRPADAFGVMRNLGLGISNKDFSNL